MSEIKKENDATKNVEDSNEITWALGNENNVRSVLTDDSGVPSGNMPEIEGGDISTCESQEKKDIPPVIEQLQAEIDALTDTCEEKVMPLEEPAATTNPDATHEKSLLASNPVEEPSATLHDESLVCDSMEESMEVMNEESLFVSNPKEEPEAVKDEESPIVFDPTAECVAFRHEESLIDSSSVEESLNTPQKDPLVRSDTLNDKVVVPNQRPRRSASKKRKADDFYYYEFSGAEDRRKKKLDRVGSEIHQEAADNAEHKMTNSEGVRKRARVKGGDGALELSTSKLSPKLSQQEKRVNKRKGLKAPKKIVSPGDSQVPDVPKEKKPRKTRKPKTPKKVVRLENYEVENPDVSDDAGLWFQNKEMEALNKENVKDSSADGSGETGTTPAISLKIICTPFSQSRKENCIGNTLDSQKVEEKNKEKKTAASEDPPPKIPKKRGRPPKPKDGVPKKRGRPPKPKDGLSLAPPKKVPKERPCPPKAKKGPPLPALKNVRKGMAKKEAPAMKVSDDSIVAESSLQPPPTEEEMKKETRGKRKKKESLPYLIDFINESDDDIEPDLSDDEYVPSKDEISSEGKTEDKKKLSVSFCGISDDDDGGIDGKISGSAGKPKKSSVKWAFKKVKKTGEVKGIRSKTPRKTGKLKAFVESDEAESPSKADPSKSPSKADKSKSPSKAKKSKRSPKKTIGVRKVPKGRSPRKKTALARSPDNNNESGMDMPLLSPSKGKKGKQKKRKVRISPKKTYFDSLTDYTTADEDFGMASATDEEGNGLERVQKTRKRRRRYGEPYSVTGNILVPLLRCFVVSELYSL